MSDTFPTRFIRQVRRGGNQGRYSLLELERMGTTIIWDHATDTRKGEYSTYRRAEAALVLIVQHRR